MKKEYDEPEYLCKYCHIEEKNKGVKCHGGQIVMCEGSYCSEAMEAYIEEVEEEKLNNKIIW